jgi:hypothetical protein
MLVVRDTLQQKDVRIIVENAKFILATTQRLTSGSPALIPENLNGFKAFRIVDGPQLGRKVQLTDAEGTQERSLLQAKYFCVPVAVRHHDDRFPIKSPKACLMVYEMNSQKREGQQTVLDLFGIRKLEEDSSCWLCVAAEIIPAAADAAR